MHYQKLIKCAIIYVYLGTICWEEYSMKIGVLFFLGFCVIAILASKKKR